MNLGKQYSFHYEFEEQEMAKKYAYEQVKTKFTYTFFNHFHPFVSDLIQQLNKHSLTGIFDPNFQDGLAADFFASEYSPNTKEDTVEVKYFKKEMDFSEGGPYSIYNWELFFFTPISIANTLSKNQRFADAQKWFHYIFDPTNDDKNVNPPAKFWKFLEFRKNVNPETIDELLTSLSNPENPKLRDEVINSIEAWRKNPFQPHAVARNRLIAYQFYVVMRYIDNLISWGDSLFRQDTIETINEATQIYVLAANILGPKPQELPRIGKVVPKTYAWLKKKRLLDAFGNALVDMEVQFPFDMNPTSTNGTTTQTNSLFGIAKTLYFCIPQNNNLLSYWTTVADRLFKIRHCMNIEGVVRQLPLFEPPIDPGMLVKAAAAGIDISSLVSGLNQPVSLVRAPLLIQKALEICSEVKTLGNALLAALEKKDSEGMALLRQEHEIKILQMVEDVKYLQWKEAEAATEALLKTRDVTFQKYRHYQLLLGKTDNDLTDLQNVTIERKELNEDNFDEMYNELVSKYASQIPIEVYRKEQTSSDIIDQGASAVAGSLGGGGDGSNLQLNTGENKELNVYMPMAHDLQQLSAAGEVIASILSLIPEASVHATPLGVGVAISFGGRELSTFASIAARIIRLASDEMSYRANRTGKLASYLRRIQDWVLQNNLAAKELTQIGRQIITSLIREQITKKEYENHKKQIEQAQALDEFLKSKFTNQDLYTWMQSEISKIYYDCYKFAFDIAKKAEQTMKYELMRKELDDIDYIKFNYWDSGRKGLLAGEALYLDLKRMEMAYHDYNEREYELTKNISLQQLDPKALLQLKANKSCEITIPETLFDVDCAGHYMRRIKTVSISVPCVVGPYTSVNCTLSLLKSSVRKSPLVGDDGYARKEKDEDDRFIDYYGTIQSIVTSTAQNDSGLFETNLRDERYLPFENGGAVSTWRLELPDFEQFDYNTISDVILHLRYTSREGGEDLRAKSLEQIKTIIKDDRNPIFTRAFSLKHDFPAEWYRFTSSTNQPLKVIIKKEQFPYLTQGFKIEIKRMDLFAISDDGLVPLNVNLNALSSTEIGPASNNELTLNPDGKVLTRDEDKEVFLTMTYYLKK